MAQTMKRVSPPCTSCVGSRTICYAKTRGPGCWRCFKRKQKCSLAGKRAEEGEEGEEMVGGIDVNGWNLMAEAMNRMSDAVEELVEEQRSIRLAVEVWLQRDEEDRKRRKTGEGNRVNRGIGTEGSAGSEVEQRSEEEEVGQEE
jgi:hypothetical protein